MNSPRRVWLSVAYLCIDIHDASLRSHSELGDDASRVDEWITTTNVERYCLAVPYTQCPPLLLVCIDLDKWFAVLADLRLLIATFWRV